MLLRLPSNLHYPITLVRVEARTGDTVKLNDNLFMYSYKSRVKVGFRSSDEEEEIDKTLVVHFPSTLEGTIKAWRKWEGDIIHEPVDLIDVEEECTHAVQYLGICTNCGKDMTAQSPGGVQDTERATIQPLHDTQHLTISQEEANKIDEEAKRRLLGARKLSLVVDLDQTIIHAAVDPTIAVWQKDKDNPNHEAVKDVRSFQLIDEGPHMRGCWYYIKLRPGLEDFLENVSQLYELHIYTMGTRQYAEQIAQIVDPERKYFGDRILSRDESGSMVAKNLERLFPVDTKMVVIIDDRGDVWKWSANLIRVTPFDFFPAIGDINSSFLPKKQEIQSTPEKKTNNGEHQVNGRIEDEATISSKSPLDQIVAMSSDDPVVREMQSKGQEEVITSQLEERPLLKMQQEQDEKDEINGDAQPTESESSDSETESASKRKARHSILNDDDEELIHLEGRLAAVHEVFFKDYDRKRMSGRGGRVAQLSGKKKVPVSDEADLTIVPDVKKVMPAMKLRVLSGVVIVFSGVLPLGTDIQTADISTWAKTFGATIADKISREVTHVIAARIGTAKVKQAVKRGIKVVGTNWLIQSIQRWRKLDERPYLLEGVGQVVARNDISNDAGMDLLEKTHLTKEDFLLSSEEETSGAGFDDSEDDEHDRESEQPARKKLKVDSNTNQRAGYDDFIDDGSPITIEQADWEDMDAELAEFMGSEVDSESDNESNVGGASKKGSKRRRDDEPEDDAYKDREKSYRGSALKTVAIPGDPSTKIMPIVRDDTVQHGQDQTEAQQISAEAETEDSDDELARQLEQELEEQENSSEAEGTGTHAEMLADGTVDGRPSKDDEGA